MESQIKPNLNGNTTNNSRSSIGLDGTSHAYNFRSSSSSSSVSKHMQTSIYTLRAIVIVLTFIASIVMGTGKDMTRVSITNPVSMQTTNFVETVRAGYSSSFVYFMIVNLFMFIYSAASLAASFMKRASTKHIELAFKISDLIFLILLFSSNGAAISTNLAIQNGNRNLGMIKICDAVSNFCAHVTASIVLSMFASISHFTVILLGMFGMHNLD